MANQKIVVHFNDGTVLIGTATNFNHNDSHFALTPEDAKSPSAIVPVEMRRVKALFFVRDFAGNQDGQPRPALACEQPYAGRKIEVTFNDGETVVGSAPNCSPDMPGFYLFPSDARGNTLKIFAVTSSIRSIRWLEGEEQRSGRDRRDIPDRRVAQVPAKSPVKPRSPTNRRSAGQRRRHFGKRLSKPHNSL